MFSSPLCSPPSSSELNTSVSSSARCHPPPPCASSSSFPLLSVLPVFLLPLPSGSSSQSNPQEENRNTHKKSRKRLISAIRRGWEQPWKSHIFVSLGLCRLQVFLLSNTEMKMSVRGLNITTRLLMWSLSDAKRSTGSRVSKFLG